MDEIKRMFTPEFRNRLDAIDLVRVARPRGHPEGRRQVPARARKPVAREKGRASFTPAMKAFLAKKGFDPQMGARPMARLIQDTIRKALADELLFGKLVGGGKVTIDVGPDEKVRLEFEENQNKEAEPVA